MGKAQQKYKAENTQKVTVEFNRKTEPDLIRWIANAKYGLHSKGITPAIKAACRKQIPQKIVELTTCGDTYYKCTSCGNTLKSRYQHYCDQCGQRLDLFIIREADILEKLEQAPEVSPGDAEPEQAPEVSPGDVEPEQAPEVSPGDVEPEQAPEVSPGDVEPEQAPEVSPGDVEPEQAPEVSPGDVEPEQAPEVSPGDVEPEQAPEVSPGDVEPEQAPNYIGPGPATKSALQAGNYIPWYRIDYLTKRGGTQGKICYVRDLYVTSKKAAIALFREWHTENREYEEGHAFRPIASYEAPPSEYRWPE